MARTPIRHTNCPRCGAQLARDNTSGRCTPCQAAERHRLVSPPALPADFWNHEPLRRALAERHLGKVIRAYRHHPYHGHDPLPQETVGRWIGITQAQMSRLENGRPVVHLDRLTHWAKILRIPGHLLWFKVSEDQDSVDVEVRLLPSPTGGNAEESVVGSLAQPSSAVPDIVSSATSSVADDPLLTVDAASPESVGSLQDDIALLARSVGMAPFKAFRTASRLRDEARALAERTRRPRVLADLYVIIAQATSLMASTAFDLGRWSDSAALARASIQYADLAGHATIKAWSYGLHMTLANWRNEPDVALNYFARGMRVAPDGRPKLRLRYIASRSHALLGDPASVAEMLAAAQRDRELAGSQPDDLASIGGEFSFDEGRAAACAAAAWLDVRDGAEAAKYARTALRVYESLPAARRPYSQITGTQIDMAAAYLQLRDKDGAAETLRTVMTLPPQKRNVSLTGRMARLQRSLTEPQWSGDSEARQLSERISAWLAETSARRLP